MEAASFDAGARATKGSRENDCSAERKCVCRVRLRGIDVHPFVPFKNRRIKPGAIRKQRVVIQRCNSRFQVKTSAHWNRNHFVTVWRYNAGELKDPFGISARGESHKKFSTDAQNVSPFDRAGKLDVCKLAKRRQRGCDGSGFAAAGFRAERKDDRQFIEHQSGIFDKHGVGKFGFSRQRNNAGAKQCEQLFVRMMLLVCDCQINRLARDETEFTAGEGRTDGASDDCKHGHKI